MLKFLEIYACLFIVFTLHETGHILALWRFKCRVGAVTIFYLSIVKFWHRNTCVRIGIIPGGYTDAAGTEKLDDFQYVVTCLAGIIASFTGCTILMIVSFWYEPQFLFFLRQTFLLDLIIGIFPWGNNDMAKALKRIKSPHPLKGSSAKGL